MVDYDAAGTMTFLNKYSETKLVKMVSGSFG